MKYLKCSSHKEEQEEWAVSLEVALIWVVCLVDNSNKDKVVHDNSFNSIHSRALDSFEGFNINLNSIF
jgi:hypothetical protein